MATISIPRRRNQAGYTLLLVMFIVATILISAAAVVPNILTQGRREKETEMVWRGQQYARAISLYYKKFGKYPTKVEDLTRQTNGVRFLRQAYTDPMNREDGSWRFIYSGPNGQLIGSLRQTSLLQATLSAPGMGLASVLGGGLQPLSPPGAAANGPAGGAAGQQGNPASNPNSLASQPQPFEGTVLGGSIAGVGSKIKKPSFRIYQGGDTYEKWEFIWTATGQVVLPTAPPANPNANPTAPPAGGDNPNGTGGPPPPPPPPSPAQ